MLSQLNAMKLSTNNKLIWGVGINDTNYNTTFAYINGKRIRCHIYIQWKDMLRRCYSHQFHQRCPTYIGCTVDPVWHYYSNFYDWYQQQNCPITYQLDKDLIYPGNKIYGPDTCILVPRYINILLRGSQSKSNLPVGVSFKQNRYEAQCKDNNKNIYLGRYHTAEEAHQAYCQYKLKIVQRELDQQSNPKIKKVLQQWIHIIQQGEYV